MSRRLVRGTRLRACQGKAHHTTRAAALAHIWRLVTEEGAARSRLALYRCRWVPGTYHVGHTRRGKR